QHGNGAPGVAVTFTPSTGVVTPQVVTTNGTGIASANWTLGAAGQQSVAVSVTGLGDAPGFTATALASGDITELQNDLPVSDIDAAEGQSRYYRVTLPTNVTSLTLSTVGGPGDADLFVRHNRLPTTAS